MGELNRVEIPYFPLTSHQPAQLNVETMPGAAARPPNTPPSRTARQTGAALSSQGLATVHRALVSAWRVALRISSRDTS